MSRRQDLQRQIADLDRQINDTVSAAKLPGLDSKPFPVGSWILTIVVFAIWGFGDQTPVIQNYYPKYGQYAMYVGGILGILAVLSTISWLFRRRGGNSEEYQQATVKARELQERRRELQQELRENDDDE